MEAVEWYKTVLRKWNDFSGRSRRREFWMFALVNFVAMIVLQIIDSVIGTPLFSGLYSLAVIIPGIAVGIRRLHDIGKSGWWMLVCLVPLVGIFVLLYFYILDSQPGSNQYGANPKGA